MEFEQDGPLELTGICPGVIGVTWFRRVVDLSAGKQGNDNKKQKRSAAYTDSIGALVPFKVFQMWSRHTVFIY
jgi:hypothetical protein